MFIVNSHFSIFGWMKKLFKANQFCTKVFLSARTNFANILPFYKQLFHISTTFMCFQLAFVIFLAKKKLAQKLLVKCWWNWLQVVTWTKIFHFFRENQFSRRSFGSNSNFSNWDGSLPLHRSKRSSTLNQQKDHSHCWM